MSEETTVPLSVKIPPATKDRLDSDAAKNFRSTTSHLLYILDWYFSQVDSADMVEDFDQSPKRTNHKAKKVTA